MTDLQVNLLTDIAAAMLFFLGVVLGYGIGYGAARRRARRRSSSL